MRAVPGRFYSGSLDGLSHQIGNGARERERRVRRVIPDKDISVCTRRSHRQVPRQSLADINHQRQPCPPVALLGTYREFRVRPVDVVQLQGDDFTCTQAEPCQQKQYCVVTFSPYRCSLRSTQNALNRFGRKIFRQTRHLPVRHWRNHRRKVRRYQSPELGEAKERPQASHHLCRLSPSISRRLAPDKRRYLKPAKGAEIDSPGAEVFVEEPVDMARVMVDGRTIQPSFFLQKYTVFVRQTLCRAACDRFSLRRDHAHIAQKLERQPQD